MTKDELRRLDEHWNAVIKTIHPELLIIVKGDNQSVETLLKNWNTGNAAFLAPSETELLSALAIVETKNAQDKATKASILALVEPTAGKDVLHILSGEDGNRLLIGVLLALDALDDDGFIRNPADWIASADE